MSQAKRKIDPAPVDYREPDIRQCGWAGCAQEAEFKAPVSRENLRQYQYFCLDHIRQFNKAWNYFEGWSREEIEAYQRADLYWHRRTWRPADREAFTRAWREAVINERIDDPFRFVDGEDGRGTGGRTDEERANALPDERKAEIILKLEPGASEEEMKRRFKEEVKVHHPDANGGDKDAEERLRLVIWAYHLLTDKKAD
jgi:DnaJ domain